MNCTRLLHNLTLMSAAMLLVLLAPLAAAQSSGSILYRFNPTTTDGLNPQAGLVADSAGNIYGTTYQGGTAGWGIVYELSPPTPPSALWTETILHEFTNGADGATPDGPLTLDASGNLFGTTIYGGVGINGNSYGTVFELSPPAAPGGVWSYAVIASFDSGQVAINPSGKLIFDTAGNLYGISSGGYDNVRYCGSTPCGNVYELQAPSAPGGAWTGAAIYDFFTKGTKDGFDPSGIIFGHGGVIFGTTGEGGVYGVGTLFKLLPPAAPGDSWTEQVLYDFTSGEGYPTGGLILGANGSFFGTTAVSGTLGFGTVFQLIAPSGTTPWSESVLYNFTGGSDGAYPVGGVLMDKSGNLYGVAESRGGNNNGNCLGGGCGALFALTPPSAPGGSWTESTLHDFAGGYDGGNPVGRLISIKGILFGVTAYGGTPKYGLGGTVFRITP
ncbi:MAG TPA: choice-of-anchor tandem repeat GloVer-containing protein [Terriglobales bacterium]|nr:choice-of-anchor tandem repeat GloVer-containing protein [Terriglobales bacterium]